MLIVRRYKPAAGLERWEYRIFYKDLGKEIRCKKRRGFESQEQALRAAEKMLGLMRLPREINKA
jgi:hypothetical protein